ncbi:MAG: cytochrome c oxidase subunit II transmembrane domain-containing protein, partial [Rhizomicrobium sp.]
MSLKPRSWRNTGITAAAVALWASAASAMPHNYQLGFQPANSPVMEQIESFHTELVYITVAVCLFVLALLVYIAIKFRAGANPTPSKVHHNTLLEVAWTIIPVIILVVIAV